MDFLIVIKSVTERKFTGYISVEVIDQDGDIIPIQVLKDALGPYMKRGGPLLLVHKNLPVGHLTKFIETTHPESGLPAIAVHGYIHNDGSSLFDDVWKEFLNPTSPVGFSIGARPLEAHYKEIEGKSVRIFDKIELYEVSVVCNFQNQAHQPANQLSHLMGLGYLDVASPIAIASKMVIKMVKKEEEKKEKEEEEEEKPKDKKDPKEDKKNDMEKSIRDQAMAEAQQMLGGKASFDIIRKQKIEIAKLEKVVQESVAELDIVKTQLITSRADGVDLQQRLIKASTEVKVWKEMFQKNSSNEQFLKQLVENDAVVVNQGIMPPNQGRQAIPSVNKARQVNDKKIQDYLTGKTQITTDAEFQKMIASINT